MKRMISALLVALFCTLPVLGAQPNPFKISDDLDAKIREGLHDLYNLDFDQAERVFVALKPQQNDHPMIAFGLTSVHWWRLSVYVLENDPKESAEFLKSVEECIEVSKRKIDAGDPTGEGWLTLGGAEGLLGRWQAANRKWMSAYFKGKGAHKHLQESLDANPAMYDAYMGLGIFDYYIATLPRFVRILGFLGQTGDKQLGLKELEKAADKGNYASIPAKLFLVNIYSSLEKEPKKAIVVLNRLREEFPVSPFIHMLTVVAMYNHGTPEELEAQAQEFVKRVDNGTYRKEFATQADFAMGLTAFKGRQWQTAVTEFDKGIAAGTVKDPFFTWSFLYKGYALDVLNRREEAKACYREVLSHIRRWGAHDNAESRLKKSFTPDDKEVSTLVL